MGKVTTPKDLTYLPLLKYTGLFGIQTKITETTDYWVIEYDDKDGMQVCMAVEEHNGYAMQFPEELQQQMMANASKELTAALNAYLNGVAQSLRYTDMKSVRSYTGFANPYQEEAIALAQWSADCWIKAGQLEQEVIAGTRAIPTLKEIIAELPAQPAV